MGLLGALLEKLVESHPPNHSYGIVWRSEENDRPNGIVVYDLGEPEFREIGNRYRDTIQRARIRGSDVPEVFIYSAKEEGHFKKILLGNEERIRKEIASTNELVREMAGNGLHDSPDIEAYEEKKRDLTSALYGLSVTKESLYEGRFFRVSQEDINNGKTPLF